MCSQSIVVNGRVRTGRLVDHLGDGMAEIEIGVERLVGTKLETWQRKAAAGRRTDDAAGNR